MRVLGPCGVSGCPNKGNHTFTKNETLRQKWVQAMKLDKQRKVGWIQGKFPSICSEHFRETDYISTWKLLPVAFGEEIPTHSSCGTDPQDNTLASDADDMLKNEDIIDSATTSDNDYEIDAQQMSDDNSVADDLQNSDEDLLDSVTSCDNDIDNNSDLPQNDDEVNEFCITTSEIYSGDLKIKQEAMTTAENDTTNTLQITDHSSYDLAMNYDEVVNEACITASEISAGNLEVKQEIIMTGEDDTNPLQIMDHNSYYLPINYDDVVNEICITTSEISSENLGIKEEIIMTGENDTTNPMHITDHNIEDLPRAGEINEDLEIKHEVTTAEKSTQTDSLMLPFSIQFYNRDNKAVHFYTGLEDFDKLLFVFQSLGESSFNLKYIHGSPPAHVPPLEQFFITLIKLRTHKSFKELSIMYQIDIIQVKNIFITWVKFMSLQWKTIDLWEDRETLNPYDEKPKTKVLMDIIEFPIKKPETLSAQQMTFSTRRNRNTVKVLIGITPNGLINYVSPCYGGSASDRLIIEQSSILKRYEIKDETMMNQRLNVEDIFLGYGVRINKPWFLKKSDQINYKRLSKRVAREQAHMNKVVGMLKAYKVLKQPMNTTETLLSSDIVLICSMLVNFRSNSN